MRIGIYTNLTRDIGGKVTLAVYKQLKGHGFEVYVSDELKSIGLPDDCNYINNAELATVSEILLVFGGDGTILRIAKECAVAKTPVFAVNIGNKGFLTELDRDEVDQIITEILNGQYKLDNRQLLQVSVEGKEEVYYALNEVVIARESCTKVVRTEISVNNARVDNYTSDGVIVCTPTGSTAYSLSAGGPIVSPDVEALVITPICAHSLHSRPLVVNNHNIVTIKINHAEPNAYLNVDGTLLTSLKNNEVVKVTKSDVYLTFIRRNYYNFHKKLLSKMRYWSSFED